MSALFDTDEMEPGRPALPEGWNVYDARVEFPLAHDRGPVDTTADEAAAAIATEIDRLGDQGITDVEGKGLPAVREDGQPYMDRVTVVLTARVQAGSQEHADRALGALVWDAVFASEQREGEP